MQSIDRAVTILRCFSPRTPELGTSDIARATGLSTSTTHRLLAAMQVNGLVRQTTERRYALGPLLVQLARSGAFPTSLRDAAMETMRRLRDQVDETVGLHELLPSMKRAVVDQAESHQPLRRTYTEIGIPLPLPQGAPGKALLAYLRYDLREQVLRDPIDRATPATITDPDALRRQLAEIRETGRALSFAERTPGIHTVAVPIFDNASRVVGCLSVSGPEVRMPRSRMDTLAVDVSAAAWQISEVLGATEEGARRCVERASRP
ncbi:IclR family transcriptional regulator [Spiractinospora alimapuensis]|uniref:IclR family transcriptional regulator n=1 Tax=Spiractinospora alimapuensis TaxID=2820884 RepID=UPI001F2B4237|nr:IclR family transcriptional regulator [Spiractinospora alimapuensis]